MKELKFIHITKCAGTFIEQVGKANNIDWGLYHYKTGEYGHWHQPFSKKPTHLKEKYDWFVIVRNPYTRIISSYLHILKVNKKLIDNFFDSEYNISFYNFLKKINDKNIVNCDYSYNSINKAFKKLKNRRRQIINPFFKKNTPKKIAKKILSFNYSLKKEFYDLKKKQI